MLFRLTQHTESTGVVAPLSGHQRKQRIQNIVIALLLRRQPKLAAHQLAVFLHQNLLIEIQRIVQGFHINKRRQRLGEALQIPQAYRRLIFKAVAPLMI
ncbi:hypothetical protein D3C72_450800 [compost metagenome]